jgi:hypothetical protein
MVQDAVGTERNQKRPVILINTQHASNGRRLCREVRDRRRQAAEHERQDTRKTPRGGGARGTPTLAGEMKSTCARVGPRPASDARHHNLVTDADPSHRPTEA